MTKNNYWLISAPLQNFYVYFELRRTKSPDNLQRIPLLTEDCNGSVAGDKLTKNQCLLSLIILNQDDTLSIIQYGREADTVVVLSQVKIKQIQEETCPILVEGYTQIYTKETLGQSSIVPV